MKKRRFLVCGFLLALMAPAAWSDMITLDPYYSGAVQHTVRTYVIPPGYPPVPPEISYRNYSPLEWFLQAEYSSTGCLCSERIQTNGYLIYDLSSLSFTALQATLELDLGLDNFIDPRALSVYSVDEFTPEFIMGLPSGGVGGLPLDLGEALYEDLEGGSALGNVDISSGSGVFEIQLNAAALDLINSTGGLLALGLHHAPGEIYYDELLFKRQPRLILGDAAAVVPAPGSAWLLVTAFILLLKRGRRIR